MIGINNLSKYKQAKYKNDRQLKSFSINSSNYAMNKKAIPHQQLNYQHIAQIKNNNFEQ